MAKVPATPTNAKAPNPLPGQKNGNGAGAGFADGPPGVIAEGTSEEPQEPAPITLASRFYKVLTALGVVMLTGMLGSMLGIFIFLLDFLDIYQFRYGLSPEWKNRWPFAPYLDYVKLQQMPGEERYQELILREKGRLDKLMTEGSQDLRQRAQALEASYKELVKSQMEYFRKRQEELKKREDEIKRMRDEIETSRKDLEARRESIETLAQQIASEAMNLEYSLIRFMEDENRLKPVQEMAASMDPRAVAGMFDEVSDSKLIYEILKGIPPERSALVLSYMDPERAGKIVKMSTLPPNLPDTGGKSYIPQSLRNLIGSAQANVGKP